MKCNQSGKEFKTKFESLSKEDGELIIPSELIPNAQLLMDYKGKSYPCTVMKILEDTKDDG